MKLPIKKKYFDKIKNGDKKEDYRDAHITFVCEETGEKLRKYIKDVSIVSKEMFENMPLEKNPLMQDPNMFDDDERLVVFEFGDIE